MLAIRHLDISRSAILLLEPSLVVCFLVMAAGGGESAAQDRMFRSTADDRRRIPDELDRPRFRERSSHRGYEVRTNQFIIVSTSGANDARWVAKEVEQSWTEFGKLADHWFEGHHQPDFGIGALQVTIDNEPPKDRDLPLTTINVVGIQTNLLLNISQGQPKLAEQLLELRKAAMLAFMHTAEMDRQMPPWVCDGLATNVAKQGLSEEALVPLIAKAGPAVPLGGQQWRFKRATQDRLETIPLDHDAAEAQVKFLLEGNDAQHAPELFAALRQCIDDANRARVAERGSSNRPDQREPSTSTTAVDRLAVTTRDEFSQWLKEPLMGQPLFEPDPSTSEELIQSEREMIFVLKLARRFSTLARGQGQVRSRVTAFDKERKMTVLSQPREIEPLPLAQFLAKITDQRLGEWATLDSDGRLLFSSEQDRLRTMLGLEDNRYTWQTVDGHTALITKLGDQRTLQGWLEENKENPLRPRARFAVVEVGAKQARITTPPLR